MRSSCELGHPFDALTISRDVGLAAASFALSDDDCQMPVSEQAIVFREAAILAMSNELNKLKAAPLRNKCIAEGVDLVLPTRAKTKADMIARYISTKMALASTSVSGTPTEAQSLFRLATRILYHAVTVVMQIQSRYPLSFYLCTFIGNSMSGPSKQVYPHRYVL